MILLFLLSRIPVISFYESQRCVPIQAIRTSFPRNLVQLIPIKSLHTALCSLFLYMRLSLSLSLSLAWTCILGQQPENRSKRTANNTYRFPFLFTKCGLWRGAAFDCGSSFHALGKFLTSFTTMFKMPAATNTTATTTTTVTRRAWVEALNTTCNCCQTAFSMARKATTTTTNFIG